MLKLSADEAMHLDWVRSSAELEQLKPHWDKLLELSATRSPFLRWEWVSRWWSHFGKGRELAVAVLRHGNAEPLMIAPLMISYGEGRLRQLLRWVTWIGGLGPVTGERMDLLLPVGLEKEVAPWICRVFGELAEAERADALRLTMVPEESPNLPWLRLALETTWQDTHLAERLESRCRRLGASWEASEKRKSGSRQRRMRRKFQVFVEEWEGERLRAEQMMHPNEAMDLLARLHERHWPHGVSNFLKPESWAFHKELAQIWLANGQAVMPGLRTPQEWVAMLYGFVENGEFYFYQHGWEERFARLSPGNLAMQWSMELANQLGLALYDMLPGEQGYKAQWCDETRALLHLEAICPNSLKGRLFSALRKSR